MRFQNLIITATLLLGATAWAKNTACPGCQELVVAQKAIAAGQQENINKGRDLLSRFEFSKKSPPRNLEIEAYVKFGAQMIRLDSEGDSDSYFYNAFAEYPNEFKAAIGKLPERDRKMLESSLADSEKATKDGNGSK